HAAKTSHGEVLKNVADHRNLEFHPIAPDASFFSLKFVFDENPAADEDDCNQPPPTANGVAQHQQPFGQRRQFAALPQTFEETFELRNEKYDEACNDCDTDDAQEHGVR